MVVNIKVFWCYVGRGIVKRRIWVEEGIMSKVGKDFGYDWKVIFGFYRNLEKVLDGSVG